VNEYTRREEVRWTLIGAVALVLGMAPAVLLLVLAQGRLIPDPAAARAAEEAAVRASSMRPCVSSAEKLVTEIDVFKSSAKAARLDAQEPVDQGPAVKVRPVYVKGKLVMPTKEKETDAALAWSAAQPAQKLAKTLVPCRVTLEGAIGPRPETVPAWEAVAKAVEVAAPSADKNEQINASRALLKLFDKAPIVTIVQQGKDAEAAMKKAAEAAQAKAATAVVREPIPEGLIPRRIAVGIGVGLSVITLLLSYLSVRISSLRRLTTLVPLREAAKVSQPGVHAAAVLRLAAQHNGGQPGMVIGAAMGGLIAALLQRADTDVFIVGVMGGCIFGLAVQWGFRIAVGASRWRERATELSEVEKPTIPIVLVLSGVNPGLEGPFITFFNGLSPTDAALTVEKLAAQAEEKILAAADAGAAARQEQQGMMPPGMMPPGMMPPR
jgi:hypothetical protein